MLKINTLVLGGGGAKGIVYPQTLRRLHEEGLINLQKIKNVAGSSAGALTSYILALGGTPYAIEKIAPTISEALPFATKKLANKGQARIVLDRATTVFDPPPPRLDGSAIPSVLQLWTKVALLHILRKITETELDDEGYGYISIAGERFDLLQFGDDSSDYERYFWKYGIDVESDRAGIAELRQALANGLQQIEDFGAYLVSTHQRIVLLLERLKIKAGWKHLAVTATRLYQDNSRTEALSAEFGSLNYVSTKLRSNIPPSESNPIYKAFIKNRGTCLMAAAQASGAFPLLFAPSPLGSSPSIRDFSYTDGGCMSNMPVELPIFLDSLISDSQGEYQILALGLNSNDEASTLTPDMVIRFAQKLMLPTLHKVIINPSQDSFFAKAKKEICKNIIASTDENVGKLFNFKMKPGGNYQIFYITMEPDAPISLTTEIPNGRYATEVNAAIDKYARKTQKALVRLEEQISSDQHWSDMIQIPAFNF